MARSKLVNRRAQRLEENLLADERHATAHDDDFGCEERDHLRETAQPSVLTAWA